jgi:Cof subfamily protein (haloacid dehalogenase superfamily)
MQNNDRSNRFKLIVFDLDGTLVDDNLEMTVEDREAIEEARRRGIAVTLATGRTFRSALPYIQKLGIELPVILCNGAAIVDPKNKRILFQQRLRRQAAVLMLEKAQDADLDCLLYTDPLSDCPSVSYLTPLLADFILLEGLHRVELNALVEIIRGNPPIKLQIVGYEEQRLLALQRFAAERIPEISVIKTQNDYLEAMPAGVSKGEALVRLGKLLRIPLSQIAAFGDSVNDRELLALAGIGIAMADAPEELKAAADGNAANVAAGLKDLLR